MTLTLEQKKAKAEELRDFRDEFKTAEIEDLPDERARVSADIVRFVCANPIEQWFLEAVEEIEALKKELSSLQQRDAETQRLRSMQGRILDQQQTDRLMGYKRDPAER